MRVGYFALSETTKKFVRLVGHGQSQSSWNSITEMNFNYMAAIPTCSDNIMNQDETGIDCGGACSSCSSSIPSHPRIWFNSAILPTVRTRWDGTEMQYVEAREDVESYLTGSSNDREACSNAFMYLITENSSYAQIAIATAETMIATDERDYDRFCGYADPVAIVFDWAYDELTSQQRLDFINALNIRMVDARDYMIDNFLYHEQFFYRTAYISQVLALWNEEGAIDDYDTARLWMSRFVEMMEEVAQDGATTSYIYQYKYQPLAIFMWDRATGDDLSDQSGFHTHMADYIIHKLMKNGYEITYSEGDVTAWYDRGAVEDHSQPSPGVGYMIASHYNDPVAQWLGDQIWAKVGGGDGFFDFPYDMPWLAFLFYDTSISAISPSAANYPLSKYFQGTEWVNIRSGFNYGGAEVEDDFVMWIYSGPSSGHSQESQGHFEIWNGMDDLAIRGGNYMGSPSIWKGYFVNSYARNTMGFVPAGSTEPDLDSSQNTDKPYRDIDWILYPANTEYTHNGSGWHATYYRGNINHFEDEVGYTIVTVNMSIAYGQVNYYLRDFIYLDDGLTIVHDRFVTNPSENIEELRWYLHTREKPLFEGVETVVQGTSSEGIIELSSQDSYIVERGNSKIELELLHPVSADIETQGGGYWAYYMDGFQYDPEVHAQCWMIGCDPDSSTEDVNDCDPLCTPSFDSDHLVHRVEYIIDQWITQFEMPESSNDGQIIVGMWTADQSDTNSPSYSSVRNVANGKEIDIIYEGQSYTVFLPSTESGNPTVT